MARAIGPMGPAMTERRTAVSNEDPVCGAVAVEQARAEGPISEFDVRGSGCLRVGPRLEGVA